MKITNKKLAEYLGVTPQAISEYKKTTIGKRKVALMLKGLKQLEQIKLIRQGVK